MKAVSPLVKQQVPISWSDDLSQLRREATVSHANGKWASAKKSFEQLVNKDGENFKNWLGLGECWLNLDDPVRAQEILRKAVALRPGDARARLQLGRALDRDGRRLGALHQWRTAKALKPRIELTSDERQRVAHSVDSFRKALGDNATHSIFLDISDVLRFLRRNLNLTGIQRVQVGVIVSVLQSHMAEGVQMGFCGRKIGTAHTVPLDLLSDLIDEVNHPKISRSRLNELLHAIAETSPEATFKDGDVFLTLGVFWIFTSYAKTITELKAQGVKIGVFVHDVIPLTHPDYFVFVHSIAYRVQFNRVMSIIDFACATSGYVASELKKAMTSKLKRSVPVISVPLAQELPHAVAAADAEFIAKLPREYVLSVGTLEIRKNHMLLLDVWAALHKKYNGKIPTLVLVGKWGWKIKPFRRALENSGFVDGKILVMGGISEARLAHLYRNCMFTVFPSFVEGWGLPVSESLAYGKPCITSKLSSMPEVGGALARYIDPFDTKAAQTTIERAIMDRTDLADWTKMVRRNFKVRSWAMVTDDLLAGVTRVADNLRHKGKATGKVPGKTSDVRTRAFS
ncbi:MULTISPECIES: glycosyltransferase [unclassified Beijerinckia]|uniref:glycosyltransferase n=1 Tax=unclassified Beijerinckia TaxID=2638183 RepID=UPI00089A5528|nr:MULTISPECIES: glycosyltransferase [unclassified Beijerinckia]MDH7796114.1 glycosyltransferase involved in cell wall biosynthesis [Beijerinckia sp. GAS462]SEC30937.1 Glycosyltransferase involved in cell wall bisynthesis [Beijerinckia sp. 28-YEA-48]